MLKSSAFKSKNYKTITIRETVPMITGIDVELQIFGVYYLYSRAVISGKVTQVQILIKKIFSRDDDDDDDDDDRSGGERDSVHMSQKIMGENCYMTG